MRPRMLAISAAMPLKSKLCANAPRSGEPRAEDPVPVNSLLKLSKP
jgi:hypothetical protein